MTLTRKELSELLDVAERYLVPSNKEHFSQGLKNKGFTLIAMEGRGAKTLYEIEADDFQELGGEIWQNLPIAPTY